MPITIKPGDDVKAEYDELQVQRSTVRRLISIREATWSQLSVNRSDLPTVEAEEHMWRTYYEKLDALDSRLRKLLVLPITEELALERNEWEDRVAEYQEKLAKGWGKLAHVRSELTKISGQAAKLDTTLQSRDESSRMNQVIVKQEPKIPKFSGDVKKFRDWFQTFETAVSGCVSDLDRFNKLKEALKGDAYKAIAHIELSDSNYSTAVEVIKEEFGSTFSAQFAHAWNIISTCNSKDFKTSDKWLASVPNIVQNIRSLKLLVKDFEGAAVMILPMVIQNIPVGVKRDFLRLHEVSKTGEAVNQLDALIKFISKESKIGPSAHATKSQANQNQNSHQGGFKNFRNKDAGGFQKSKDNHTFFGKQETEGDHSCLFCESKNHISPKCKAVLTNAERLEIVKKAQACTRCLRRNHLADKCRAKISVKTAIVTITRCCV